MVREFLKKGLIFTIIFALGFSPAIAEEKIKILADVDTGFTMHIQDLPEEISFVAAKSQTIPNLITIPEDSRVVVSIINAEVERRWHKSGIIIGKIKNYTPDGVETPIDVSDKEIYVVIRRYEPINKKEAWIIGTEIVVMSGASFFAPGVDVGYFFLKGAALKNKHENRFLSGVSNAYDNSICWFWLKGKPIELKPDDLASVKSISKEKAEKLISKVEKRNAKRVEKYGRKIAKLERKIEKREYKNSQKEVYCAVVENAIEDELFANDAVESGIFEENL